MAEYVWLYTGLELAMGPSTDRKLSAWEESFLPAKLMEHLNRVTIDDGAGNRVPLIKSSTQLYKSNRVSLPDRPPNWWCGFLLVGIALGGAMVLLATRTKGDTRRPKGNTRRTKGETTLYVKGPVPFRSRAPRILLITLAIFWAAACSLASLFMLFVWFFTDHEAGYRNQNLFQFSPISLLVLAAAIFGFRWKWSRPIVLVVLAVSILNVVLKPLPWLYEWNWEIIALALPVHAGLAIALLMLQNNSVAAGSRS
jgi:Na+/melibiose symporter-like transporter